MFKISKFLYPVCEYLYDRYSDCLFNIYGYFELRTTWHRGLVVIVLQRYYDHVYILCL